MLLKKIFFSLLIISSIFPYHSYGMNDIPILSADNSIITGSKYFMIHTSQSCEVYKISHNTKSSDCNHETFKELFDNNHCVVTFHDQSWELIDIAPISVLIEKNDKNEVYIYAQNRLDPDYKPKAASAQIQKVGYNWRITFFDSKDNKLFSLPYNGPEETKKITSQDLAPFRRYLWFEDNMKIDSICVTFQVKADDGCVLF